MNESGYVESRYHPSDTVFRGSALGEIGVNADGNKFCVFRLLRPIFSGNPGKIGGCIQPFGLPSTVAAVYDRRYFVDSRKNRRS